MNAYVILVGLLLLAWVGEVLARPRNRRSFGLSSGTEFLLAGILLGPLGMNLITRSTLDTMGPLTLAAASWLALLAGSHLGRTVKRPRALQRRMLGLLSSVAVFGASAVLAWWTLPMAVDLGPHERLYLALGLGCAGSETARAVMQWSAETLGARGPLQRALTDFAEEDDIVPLIGLAVLFAIAHPESESLFLKNAWTALGFTVGIGVVMGAVTAILLRIEDSKTGQWVVVLGTALLVTGATSQLDLAAPAALMAMGITLNLMVRQSYRSHRILAATARPVLLPVVALAGAHLDLRDGGALWLAVLLVIAVRLAIKLPVAAAVRRQLAPPTVPSRGVGLALMACGPITVCVGLTVAARFPGPVGRLVLATCLASIVLGDVVGRPVLRRELKRAGEWRPSSASPGDSGRKVRP